MQRKNKREIPNWVATKNTKQKRLQVVSNTLFKLEFLMYIYTLISFLSLYGSRFIKTCVFNKIFIILKKYSFIFHFVT